MPDEVRQHSVRIRVPELGLMQRHELEEAARATGAYSTVGEAAGSVEWVRFDFAASEQARNFQRSAVEIVGDLVEDAPRQQVTRAA
jgi:hypothetical protein